MMTARRQDSDPGVRLSSLLQGLTHVPDSSDVHVTHVTLDSRQVEHGSLFIALPGTLTHGIQFAEAAAQQGAVAVIYPTGTVADSSIAVLEAGGTALVPVPDLVATTGVIASRFFDQPSHALPLVGVTGTDGKTSVSHLLAQVLDGDTPCGLLGTLGSGRVSDLQPFGLTTPDAVTLQRHLAEFVSRGYGHAVMEVSSHALAQHRASGCRFAAAVLTNLGRDHLDYHGDSAAYAAAKARLFQLPGLGAAVLNLDDPFSATLLDLLAPQTRVFGYAQSMAAPVAHTLRAARVEADARGVTIQLDEPFAGHSLRAPLLGDFNAANVLAVACTLLALDWRMPRIVEALSACKPIPGRMETVHTAAAAQVVVDYSHTPQSLQRALAALRPLTSGKLWCVFGCGGDRDRGKRPLMGEIAETYADAAIVTDDNPRSEDPASIVTEILAGMRNPSHAQVCQPREAAIRQALRQAGPQDCILIAGKGHEPYQLLGTRRLAFDDREMARALAREVCE